MRSYLHIRTSFFSPASNTRGGLFLLLIRVVCVYEPLVVGFTTTHPDDIALGVIGSNIGAIMYISIENYLILISTVCAIYTSCLYFFYLINYFFLVEVIDEDPLFLVIKRAALVTLCLYILAGLAYLAG